MDTVAVEPTPNAPPFWAVTSLSPDPSQAKRQHECVASWQAAGCTVVALQTDTDAIVEAEWPDVTVVRADGASEWPRLVAISTMARWIADNVPGGDVAMLINADIELTIGADRLRELGREAGSGLCYVHRHESNGERCTTGIDAFIFLAASAVVIPDSGVLAMGKPYWDWAMPYAFLRAHRPLCSPAFPTLRHATHALRWSDVDHARCRRECHRLFKEDLKHHTFLSKTRTLGRDPTAEERKTEAAVRMSEDELYAAAHPYGF